MLKNVLKRALLFAAALALILTLPGVFARAESPILLGGVEVPIPAAGETVCYHYDEAARTLSPVAEADCELSISADTRGKHITLTLNGLSLSFSEQPVLRAACDLELCLSGRNVITGGAASDTASGDLFAVDAAKNALTITGPGTLAIDAADAGGLCAGALTVTGGAVLDIRVSGASGQAAVSARQLLAEEASTLFLRSESGCGLALSGAQGLRLKGDTAVTALGGGTGVSVQNALLDLSGGGTLTLAGPDGAFRGGALKLPKGYSWRTGPTADWTPSGAAKLSQKSESTYLAVTTEEIESGSDIGVETGTTGLFLSDDTLVLQATDTRQLYAAPLPAAGGARVLWNSTDPSVVTVDRNGLVTATGPGRACIVATAGRHSRFCAVTVTPIPVQRVALDHATLQLERAQTQQLRAAAAPENATDRRVSWSSSDPAVATVDYRGRVTGVGAGTAVITAAALDGGHSASCAVTVTVPAGIEIGTVTLSESTGYLPQRDDAIAAHALALTAPENADYTLEPGSRWVHMGGLARTAFAQGETFGFLFTLKPRSGYYFSCGFNAAALTVNGLATGYDGITAERLSNGRLRVTVLFSVPCKVSYWAGGGTGTMEPGEARAGVPFTLPACGYTAPAGKEFQCWRVAGSEMAPGQTFHVRTDTTVYAVWQDHPKEPTPEALFTVTGSDTVTLSNVAPGMQYRLYSLHGAGEWMDITGYSVALAGLNGGESGVCSVYLVKRGDGFTTADSEVQALHIPAAVTPRAVFSATGYSTGTLTGLTPEMQYRVDAGQWMISTGTSAALSGLSAGSYISVQVPARVDALASPVQFIWLERPEQPRGISFEADGYDSGTLRGVDPGMRYSTDGIHWQDCADGVTHVSGVDPAFGLLVAQRGVGTATADPQPVKLSLARGEAPDATVLAVSHCSGRANDDGAIGNLSADLEWRKAGAEDWTPCGPGVTVTGLVPGIYQVRRAAVGARLASEAISVTVKPYGVELGQVTRVGSDSVVTLSPSVPDAIFDITTVIATRYDDATGQITDAVAGIMSGDTVIFTGRDLTQDGWSILLVKGTLPPLLAGSGQPPG